MFRKLFITGLSISRYRNMSSVNEIIIDKIGNVTTIGINRPSKRNCVNSRTALLLRESIDNFENDESAYAAVLYGTGGNFCSGFDFQELADVEDESKISEKLDNGLMSLPNSVKKPMVAAISGYAVAGGLELALLCDLRVMEDTAILGLYSRRFGVPLVDGATVRLQAMLGLSRAMDMILTGRSLNAKEAFDWGVANRIVACGTALGQAINLASSLVKFPQECLHIDRESTYNAAFNRIYHDLLEAEKKHAKRILSKDAIIEGAKRFLSGTGKHGKTYNLKAKDICDWEKEYEEQFRNKPKSKL